jgi:hypothetical protein
MDNASARPPPAKRTLGSGARLLQRWCLDVIHTAYLNPEIWFLLTWFFLTLNFCISHGTLFLYLLFAALFISKMRNWSVMDFWSRDQKHPVLLFATVVCEGGTKLSGDGLNRSVPKSSVCSFRCEGESRSVLMDSNLLWFQRQRITQEEPAEEHETGITNTLTKKCQWRTDFRFAPWQIRKTHQHSGLRPRRFFSPRLLIRQTQDGVKQI